MEYLETFFLLATYLSIGLMAVGGVLTMISAVRYAKLQRILRYRTRWERELHLEQEFTWGVTCATITIVSAASVVVCFLLGLLAHRCQ